MSDAVVGILKTGVANVASVRAALERCGASTIDVESADEVHDLEYLVFPGVGSFGAGMARLRRDGLAEALSDRFAAEKPTLAICLGLQLLFESSDESPGVEGLGILPGHVARFPDGVRVPQFGWNRIEAEEDCRVLRSGHVYFANSYRVQNVPAGWCRAVAHHGGPFVAAFEKGAMVACQFHPELSGSLGMELLSRWMGKEEGC
ncbi:MAG: imidazole glycerol phosphate synthase subunit HisH [Bradymonadaceae bacterium]